MTAALRHPIWDATDALADMQSRRRVYLRHAAAADWNNEPGVAAMWQREADQLDDQIAAHLHGVAIFEANKLDHDRHDVPDDEQRLSLRDALGMAACALLSIALIAWMVTAAADTGPHCPGADPAWMGWCSEAPQIGGAL